MYILPEFLYAYISKWNIKKNFSPFFIHTCCSVPYLPLKLYLRSLYQYKQHPQCLYGCPVFHNIF